MLDPAAHCPGASYCCWELLGHKNASAHALLTQSCFEGCQKSVGENILYHPKIPLKKSLFFFEGDNLPSCLALLFWFLATICWTTVYAAFPVPLWEEFYQGHWEDWSSLDQAYDVGAPSRFLTPSGLWLFQVVSCLVSTFCSRQEAADSLLCDRWSSLRWVLHSSAALQALLDQGKGHCLIQQSIAIYSFRSSLRTVKTRQRREALGRKEDGERKIRKEGRVLHK